MHAGTTAVMRKDNSNGMEVDSVGQSRLSLSAVDQSCHMDGDDDDDWQPKAEVGVVLRPHLLRWTPAPPTADADAPNQLGTDPLHDPAADDDDQHWVAEKLMQPDEFNNRVTDAVLNCPGCFTPLCYQCQRHKEYANQWRAVEVRHCKVDRSASLAPQKGDPSRYFAVRCELCNADVGLLDENEIYHLFHVLESRG
mmetsp:Transcript_60401/g.112133  ORF Transcript_60401/g.112133 Transcript_60401/m.112133 type:complete len:196 (-) Transcript_60401:193-780(-)